MIHNVAYTSASAAAARRAPSAAADPARTARPQPAAESDAAVVELDHGNGPVAIGGFGLDLAYSRQVTRHVRGQAPQIVSRQSEAVSIEFRFATQALPRGEDGEVDLEALANTEEKSALVDALQQVAEQGLQDPGALASFVDAVGDLFGEYEQDLGLSEGDLAQARTTFVDEVKSFFARADSGDAPAAPAGPAAGDAPASDSAAVDPLPEGFEALDSALQGLHDRLMARRRDVLTAAGDLSKALGELTADAAAAPEGSAKRDKAHGRLGQYLSGLKDALSRRSTRELRDAARARLLETDAEIADRAQRRAPSDEAVRHGRDFLRHLHAA